MAVVGRVSGPVVIADGLEGAKMFDVVRVGSLGLVGEVIRLVGAAATIQVYEDTTGIRPGDPIENTGQALSVELGPGLLKSIYDGVQRPLDVIQKSLGDFITRGFVAPPLDEAAVWEFTPTAKVGSEVTPGTILGTVQETPLILHKIMVPPGVRGTLKELKAGSYTIRQPIGAIQTAAGATPVFLSQKWVVRIARPVQQKLPPTIPLITGQRVIDSFFPVAKGGTACIPGPFGSGKTVTQQQLAKWADSDVVVYVGCGERGNEMTEVLATFPSLLDPKSKRPADGADRAHREHLEHAGRRARGERLHRASRSRSTTGTWATTSRSWPTRPAAGPRRCERSRAVSRRCPARRGIRPTSAAASPSSTSARAAS